MIYLIHVLKASLMESILYFNISSPRIEELYLKKIKTLNLKAIIKDLIF